jgi:pimeloyl-ACP methyl ester carboxylesterase
VPDLPRKVIAATSHWLPMDEPDEFNGILDEFLATID